MGHRNLINGRNRAGAALVWIASAVVLAGAVYFGLASCGGYLGHKTIFRVVAPVLVLTAVLVPGTALSTVWRKLGFVAALALAYFCVEAMLAPLYPAPPETLGAYGRLFLLSLQFGPCG